MPTDFVGSDYYRESGVDSSWTHEAFYLSYVLWDGAGCSDPKLPWFYRQLSDATQDDIEVRLCNCTALINQCLMFIFYNNFY